MVFFAFVDECEQRCIDLYGVGILLIDSLDLNCLETELREFADEILGKLPGTGSSTGLEFHGYDMFHGCSEWRNLERHDRIWAYKKAVSIVLRHIQRFIVKPINSKKMLYSDPHEMSLLYGLERAEEYARNKNIRIIADKKPESDKRIQRAFEHAKNNGTGGWNNSNLTTIDSRIKFADSKRSRGIQACDILLYIIFRKLRNDQLGGNKESIKAVDEIYKSLRRKVSLLATFP